MIKPQRLKPDDKIAIKTLTLMESATADTE